MGAASSVAATVQDPLLMMSNRYSNRESYQKGLYESANQSYSFGAN